MRDHFGQRKRGPRGRVRIRCLWKESSGLFLARKGVLYAADGVLDLALGLVALALGLKLAVAGQVARTFLDIALHLLQGAFGPIFVHQFLRFQATPTRWP